VLFVDKKYFVIVDEATGDATGNIDIHFQLGPGNAIFDNKAYTVRSDFKEGWNVLVKSMEQKFMNLIEEEGQVSFIYTKKEPRPAFCYNIPKTTAEGVRFITVVAPYEGDVPDVKAKFLGKPAIGASNIEIEVTVNGKKKRISYTL